MKTRTLAALAAAATLAPAAFAQEEPPASHAEADGASHAAGNAVTMSLQGEEDPEMQAWWNNPHMGRAYQFAVMTFEDGVENVDEAEFREASEGIIRDFAVSLGYDPDMMVDHMRLIPGQVLDLAAEDPSFLDSYESFKAAMFGPD
ncbi:MAG: hypothetical protein PVI23_07215 [Maricaulaceae bacterium]